MTKLMFAIAALAVATPVVAQSQAAMNAQAGQDLKRSDAAMNAQWQRTYAYMKGRDRFGNFGYAAKTLDSQRAWLKFRDAQCTIEGGQYAGGTAEPMARTTCLARLTKQRTAQLKEMQWPT